MIPYENLNRLNQSFERGFQEKFNLFLKKGWYILGSEVQEFEQAFAQYCGSQYCIGLANGLDALELGLQVFDFPKNSEVLVPSNTYIATILAILNAGLKPILVEPELNTYNIDPAQIEEKITPETRAIMVVHLYGQMAAMPEIMTIAQKHNLEVIEDCAQAHGAHLNHQIAGTFGNIGAYSFYPTKNLGALGDAGAIITSDEALYIKLKALRNYGSEKKYYNQYTGKNSRLDEIQAGFLNVKLPKLNQINAHKLRLAEIYNKGLTNKVIKPIFATNGSHVYHIYNIRTPNRDALKQYLSDNGIASEIHYPVAPHHQVGYRMFFPNEQYPLSESIHQTTLSLPISYAHTEVEIQQVVACVNEFFEN